MIAVVQRIVVTLAAFCLGGLLAFAAQQLYELLSANASLVGLTYTHSFIRNEISRAVAWLLVVSIGGLTLAIGAGRKAGQLGIIAATGGVSTVVLLLVLHDLPLVLLRDLWIEGVFLILGLPLAATIFGRFAGSSLISK